MPACAASGVKNVSLYYRYSCDNATWTEWQQYEEVDSNPPYSWYNDTMQPGFYEFYAGIYDNLNHFNATDIASVSVPLDITYTLHKGWNLISVPIGVNWHAWDLAQYINTHNNLSQNIVTTIVMFDAVHQHHIGWVDVMPGLNNFSIENGRGYWVYAKENATIRWHGKPAESISMPLYKGYNLIGWIGECLPNTNISHALRNVENATMAIEFNSTTQNYSVYISSLNSGVFNVKLGDAFYIYCTNNDIWTGRD